VVRSPKVAFNAFAGFLFSIVIVLSRLVQAVVCQVNLFTQLGTSGSQLFGM